MENRNIILTGCAGFIGSNFVNKIASIETEYNFHIIDALTYAGRYQNIEKTVEENSHLFFHTIDIRDQEKIEKAFHEISPNGVIHFAAESHVDRSIENPNIFVETNVLGTLNLLNSSLGFAKKSESFRFIHVSTDEVYGSLKENDHPFTENTPLAPNSPYSASKTSSDLMVRSYCETYKFPAIITRCSNNYGPLQFPEKLIPLMIKNALQEQSLPVYGDGRNIRDWIFVDDHNRGIWSAFKNGRIGEVYNFGGDSEVRNIDVVKTILKKLDKSESLIKYVEDRKGHDWRYAIDFSKAKEELGWEPSVDFSEGLSLTLQWYLENLDYIGL